MMDDDDDDELYEVDDIIDSRLMPDGTMQYRVRWANFSPDHDTWEPVDNLDLCKDLIEKFDTTQQKPTKRRTTSGPGRKTGAKNKSPKISPKNSQNSQISAAQAAEETVEPSNLDDPFHEENVFNKFLTFSNSNFALNVDKNVDKQSDSSKTWPKINGNDQEIDESDDTAEDEKALNDEDSNEINNNNDNASNIKRRRRGELSTLEDKTFYRQLEKEVMDFNVGLYERVKRKRTCTMSYQRSFIEPPLFQSRPRRRQKQRQNSQNLRVTPEKTVPPDDNSLSPELSTSQGGIFCLELSKNLVENAKNLTENATKLNESAKNLHVSMNFEQLNRELAENRDQIPEFPQIPAETSKNTIEICVNAVLARVMGRNSAPRDDSISAESLINDSSTSKEGPDNVRNSNTPVNNAKMKHDFDGLGLKTDVIISQVTGVYQSEIEQIPEPSRDFEPEESAERESRDLQQPMETDTTIFVLKLTESNLIEPEFPSNPPNFVAETSNLSSELPNFSRESSFLAPSSPFSPSNSFNSSKLVVENTKIKQEIDNSEIKKEPIEEESLSASELLDNKQSTSNVEHEPPKFDSSPKEPAVLKPPSKEPPPFIVRAIVPELRPLMGSWLPLAPKLVTENGNVVRAPFISTVTSSPSVSSIVTSSSTETVTKILALEKIDSKNDDNKSRDIKYDPDKSHDDLNLSRDDFNVAHDSDDMSISDGCSSNLDEENLEKEQLLLNSMLNKVPLDVDNIEEQNMDISESESSSPIPPPLKTDSNSKPDSNLKPDSNSKLDTSSYLSNEQQPSTSYGPSLSQGYPQQPYQGTLTNTSTSSSSTPSQRTTAIDSDAFNDRINKSINDIVANCSSYRTPVYETVKMLEQQQPSCSRTPSSSATTKLIDGLAIEFDQELNLNDFFKNTMHHFQLEDRSVEQRPAKEDFYEACRLGHFEIVRAALCAAKNTRSLYDVNATDSTGDTLLMSVTKRKCDSWHFHDDVIELLVQNGANLNACNKNGDSALMIAILGEHLCKVSKLLSLGAAVNLPNKNGETPLMVACQKFFPSVVARLLEYGADFNALTTSGKSVFAIASSHKNISKILQSHERKVKYAFDHEMQVVLDPDKLKIKYAVFPLHCYALNESRTFRLMFNHSWLELSSRQFGALFIGVARFGSQSVHVRLWGNSPVTGIKLNTFDQKPITDEGHFIFTFSTLQNGPNELLIRCNDDHKKSQSKLLIQAFVLQQLCL